jgi:hypothetical protein
VGTDAGPHSLTQVCRLDSFAFVFCCHVLTGVSLGPLPQLSPWPYIYVIYGRGCSFNLFSDRV